ncbi:MAG: hypothetical protein IPI42_10530 [Saprospiraceae bacterium]|nr:hypothetical protein [Candidatus Parvibacillus calidus]
MAVFELLLSYLLRFLGDGGGAVSEVGRGGGFRINFMPQLRFGTSTFGGGGGGPCQNSDDLLGN